MKVLFAMEYVLQGLANPFQGITYHSFFRHFHFTYGVSEAATQSFFQNHTWPGVLSQSLVFSWMHAAEPERF